MVSPREDYPTRAAEVPPMGDRGIREPVVTPVTPAAEITPAYRYFWGSVIAGTLTAMTFFVLSMSLMFGCRVGVYNPNGTLSLGWGSAIWVIVTVCLAEYIGGMIAARISGNEESAWLRGATVWGLSVPLAAVVLAFVAIGAGVGYAATTPTATAAPTVVAAGIPSTHLAFSPGESWTTFIALILGAGFALAGAMSGAKVRRQSIR